MTIICAMHDPDAKCTWIGSDGQCNDTGTIFTGVKKWAAGEFWAVAAAGNLRTVNLLIRHSDALFLNLESPFEFSCRARDLLRDDDYNTDKDEGPKSFRQHMILANYEGVWSIGPTFEVMEFGPGQFCADGSGYRLALGAAHVALGKGISAEETLRLAIDAAKRYDDHCGGLTFIGKLE